MFGPQNTRPEERQSIKRNQATGSVNTQKTGTRICNRTKLLWNVIPRALGFPLLTNVFEFLRHPLGKGLHEPTKTAIYQDRSVALLRALVHVIPVSAALCEIILNWNIYYVGGGKYSQATYQLVAKVHELMIQASLAAIIFAAIRNEVAFGQGIPFGLLSSGLQTTQLSYLWSMEFWGSVQSSSYSSYRRIRLLVIILLCVLLASVCGPSSAVLLVPRSQFWPGGSTDVWINATQNDLWPNRTEADSIAESCLEVVPDKAVDYDICPSAQWQTIREYLALSEFITPLPYADEYDVSLLPDYIELADRASLRQISIGSYTTGLPNTAAPAPVLALTQHAAIADALTNVGSLWFVSLTNVTGQAGHGAPLSDQSDAKHTILKGYKQPYGTSVCVRDSMKSPHDTTPIGIPLLINANSASLADGNITYEICEGNQVAQTVAHPSMTRGRVFDLSKSRTQYSLHWTELEPDLFNGSSIGAIISLPSTQKNTTRDVLICNLAAGWGDSSISVRSVQASTSVVTSTPVDQDPDDAGKRGGSFKEDTQPLYESIHGADGEVEGGFDNRYPQQLINITADWAKFLNPTIAGRNTTVIDTLLQEQIASCNPLPSAEIALISLVVNGLARSASQSQLQGTLRTRGPNGSQGIDGNYWVSGKGNVFHVDPSQSKDWTKLHVDSTLEGYFYNTAGLAPRVAIAFLLIYCFLAVGHVIYAGWTGISSTSWDSISETTALAMNSTPTAALRNTCAGIKELHIFKLPVRVLVRKDEEGEGEHLELVFGSEAEREKTDDESVKANRSYGTMNGGGRGE